MELHLKKDTTKRIVKSKNPGSQQEGYIEPPTVGWLYKELAYKEYLEKLHVQSTRFASHNGVTR